MTDNDSKQTMFGASDFEMKLNFVLRKYTGNSFLVCLKVQIFIYTSLWNYLCFQVCLEGRH